MKLQAGPVEDITLAELVARAKAQALAPIQTELPASGFNPQVTAPRGAPDAGGLASLGATQYEGTPLAVELITTRELAELAARLTHAKNEHKNTIGRALLRAISGQLWAPDGYRNSTAYQISAECVEAYPNLDAPSAARCFSAAISNAQSQGSKMTLAKWQGMFERVQADRQTRLNMVGQFAARQSAIGEALEQQARRTWFAPMPEASPLPVPFRAEPVLPSGAPQHPTDALSSVVHSLIIVADGSFYLRRPNEAHYRWRLKDLRSLRIELARQFGVQNQTIVTHDSKGNALPETQFLEVYGSNAHASVYDYSSEHTTWGAERATLHIGFSAELPAPAPSLAVHDWLCALVGQRAGFEPEPGQREPVEELYDWIAGCTREHINKPAVALCIVGPAEAGKGVFTLAMAHTWGVLPVKLSNAVERFNASLLSSPFWHADERTPEGLTDDLFRTIVQERVRLVEPKGKEKVELRGCGRMLFTLNDPADFHVGGVEGPDAVQAVSDRVAYYDCRGLEPELRKAQAPLMLSNGDMDLPRIVAHLRWVQTVWAQENAAPRVQRFLGSRTDREEAKAFVVRQIARNYADVYESLIEYLTQPATWEVGYHADRRQFDDGLRCPLVTQHQCLWVWQTELNKRLANKDPRALRNALKAIRSGKHTEISFGARKLRADYQEIDLDKLAIAANIEVGSESWNAIVRTVAEDTRVRRPELF
jgi:hypothetical protein